MFHIFPLSDPTALLQAMGPWVLVGLFAMIFIESGCLFPFLPGGTLLLTASSIHRELGIGLPALFLISAVAAFLGDQVGYYLGARFGRGMFKPDARLLKTRYLEQCEAFFARYGAPAVALGRFVSVVRTYMPLSAGIARMPHRRFTVWNVVGGVAWVGQTVLCGTILGSVPFLAAHLDLLAGAILIASVMPIALSSVIRSGRVRAFRQRYRVHAGRVGDDERRRAHHQLVWAGVLAVLLVAAGRLIVHLRWSGPETALLNRLVVLGPSWLGGLAVGVSVALSPMGASVIAIALMLAAWWRRGAAVALHFLWLTGFPWFLTTTIKLLVGRARPDPALLVIARAPQPGHTSFPSGHTVFATGLVIAAACVAATAYRRKLIVALAGIVYLGMALCRMYVGAHYPSDVAASLICVIAAVLLAQALWTLYLAPLVSSLGERGGRPQVDDQSRERSPAGALTRAHSK